MAELLGSQGCGQWHGVQLEPSPPRTPAVSPCWGQDCVTSSLVIRAMGQSAAAASLQTKQLREQCLVPGRTATSSSSIWGKAESCTWVGTAPGTSRGWGHTAGAWLGRKGPDGQQDEQEPATRPSAASRPREVIPPLSTMLVRQRGTNCSRAMKRPQKMMEDSQTGSPVT